MVAREIDAPAALVSELMAAIGQGRQNDDDGAAVLERAGNELVCEFWTTVPVPVPRVEGHRRRDAT